MTAQHFLPGKSLVGPSWAGKQGKVTPGEETDDQSVTLDILRVVKSISCKLTAPLDSCLESDVDHDREHSSHHDRHIVHSSNCNTNKKMVDIQPSSTEDDMLGCDFPQVKSVKQKNTKSVKKSEVSKVHVLSESENEGPTVSVKPMSRSSARTSSSRQSLGIQLEATDNQQMITCFDSMNAEDGDAVMNSDVRIHELDGDISNFSLYLIKVPAEMSLSALPKHIRLDGVQDFAVETKRYELQAFDDDNLKSVSLVQQDMKLLTEGPRFQGQIHIVKKPRHVLKPASAAKISHNTVPFPSGLKVRFKPFGAGDEPQAKKPEKQKEERKKKGSSDVVTPPKKKKKKRH